MPRLYKALGFTIAAAMAILSVAFLVGLSLPKEHTVARRLLSHQPADAVWDVLVNFSDQASWRSNLAEVKRLADIDGLEAWQESFKSGESLIYLTIISDPPRRLVRRLAPGQQEIEGTWEFLIEPGTERTSITLIERARIDSPMARFVFAYIFGQDQYIEGYLASLAQKLGDLADVQLDKVQVPEAF